VSIQVHRKPETELFASSRSLYVTTGEPVGFSFLYYYPQCADEKQFEPVLADDPHVLCSLLGPDHGYVATLPSCEIS
jgi:hypothetical protein